MEQSTVELVGASAARDIDDCRRVAKLCLKEIALNLEFLDGIEGRCDGAVANTRVPHLHSVVQIAACAFALAADEQTTIRALRCGSNEAGRPGACRQLRDDAGRK